MSLLTASLDDIVFAGRNQAYGAYQLRQEYQSRLTTAGGITLGLCALLLGSWLAWPVTKPEAITEHHVIACPIDIPPPVAIEKPKQAALALPQAPRPALARTHPAPVIPTQVAKDDLVPPAPQQPLVETPVEDGLVGPTTAPGVGSDLGTPDGVAGGTTTTGPATDAPATTTSEVTYVEKMPEFAGGQAALMRYLRDHLRYPGQALRDQIEGRVFLSFVVRADGTIADVTVLKGLGYGLDEEAQRVVRQMPAWTPGYQAQHAVAVRFTLPITFKIQ